MQKQIVFILGMHRSGTAALARVLSLCGGSLPPRLSPPSESNPRGHWEPAEATELNEAFLSRHASSWTDPTLRLSRDLISTSPDKEKFVGDIRQLIRGWSNERFLVVKEPRITALIECWIEAARSEELAISVAVAVRHPDEVAASLAKAHHMPTELGHLLWLKYTLLAERHSRNFPRVFVDYPSLVNDWRSQISRISNALCIDLTQADAAGIDEFLDLNLYRNRQMNAAVTRTEGLPIREVYRMVAAAASDAPLNIQVLDEILDKYGECERTICIGYDAFRERLAPAAESATRIQRLREDLPSLKGERAARIAEKDKLIGNISAYISQRYAPITRYQLTKESPEFATAESLAFTAQGSGAVIGQPAFLGSESYFDAYPDIAALGVKPHAQSERFEHGNERQPGALADDADRPVNADGSASPRALKGAERQKGFFRFGKARPKLSLYAGDECDLGETIRRSVYFDAGFYLAKNPDVKAAGVDPALHYYQYGGAEGRDPGPHFSTKGYLALNPDVLAANINALAHYELQGRDEGRKIRLPEGGLQRSERAAAFWRKTRTFTPFGDINENLVRPLLYRSRQLRSHIPTLRRQWTGTGIASDTDHAVYCHYDRSGVVHDYILHALEQFAECGIAVTFVSNAPSIAEPSLRSTLKLVNRLILRRNWGYDFGAYREGINSIANLKSARSLIVMNDSVYGPIYPLKQILEIFDREGCDFSGTSDNWDRSYHLQSYFLRFSNKALNSKEFCDFWQRFPIANDKNWIIEHGEIGLSNVMARAGMTMFSLCAYLESSAMVLERIRRNDIIDSYSQRHAEFLKTLEAGIVNGERFNQSHYFWEFLIREMKFPFLKRDLISKNPVNIPYVFMFPKVLADCSDYNVDLIMRHLKTI